jgi:hypothetical protein
MDRDDAVGRAIESKGLERPDERVDEPHVTHALAAPPFKRGKGSSPSAVEARA